MNTNNHTTVIAQNNRFLTPPSKKNKKNNRTLTIKPYDTDNEFLIPQAIINQSEYLKNIHAQVIPVECSEQILKAMFALHTHQENFIPAQSIINNQFSADEIDKIQTVACALQISPLKNYCERVIYYKNTYKVLVRQAKKTHLT